MVAVAWLLATHASGPAVAGKKVSCEEIAAAMKQGDKSADQVASDLGVGVKRVGRCMNPEAANAAKTDCSKIVAAMGTGDNTADEVAAQLGVGVKRVRKCMKTAAASP
jgi:hypothetical protein